MIDTDHSSTAAPGLDANATPAMPSAPVLSSGMELRHDAGRAGAPMSILRSFPYSVAPRMQTYNYPRSIWKKIKWQIARRRAVFLSAWRFRRCFGFAASQRLDRCCFNLR